MRSLGLFLGVVFGWATLALAQPNAKDLVKFDLISSTSAVEGGKPFTLAIRATIQPKWHIYWLNPGDSGMATSFQLTLPAGWKAGEVQFPIPHKFDQPGGFVGYGYLDEAVFLVEITPAATVPADSKIEVSATYLVCDTICLPGRQTVSVTLLSGKASAVQADPFEAWRQNLPRHFSNAVDAEGVQTQGKLTAAWSEFSCTVHYAYPIPGKAADKAFAIEAFPLLDDAVEVRNIKTVAKSGIASEITFEARLLAGQEKMPDSIKLLAVYTKATGERIAYWITVATK
jgi:DsbC/DsbD-like thiol-disulfide interchange protein